jgi:predicted DCC family thiol-disulfide oxidoreductase YuxK
VRVAQGSSRLQVLYDADCGFCTRTARLLDRLDRSERLDLVPLQEAGALVPDAPPVDRLLDRMHVRDGGGNWSIGADGWLRIATVVPALRPLAALARVPFVRPLVESAYAWIAQNRHRVSRLLGDGACSKPVVRQ